MNEREKKFQNLMADVIPRQVPKPQRLVSSEAFNDYITRNLPDLKAFLNFIARNPLLNCTDVYCSLNWGTSKGNRIKRLALRLNLAVEENVQLARGRGRLMATLCLAEKGYQLLKLEPDAKGKGGSLHRAYQHVLKKRLAMLGIDATIEHYQNGKNVDLGFSLNGQKWAVEVTLTAGSNELQNLDKDLQAGFDRIFFIVKDLKTLKKAENPILDAVPQGRKHQIHVGLFEDFFESIKSEMGQ